MLHVSASLPNTPDDVTPAWLTAALRTERPRVCVDSLEITSIVWGAATKVLLEATYSGADAEGLPRRLCVKAGLDERLAKVSNDAIHLLEARFYGDLRHRFATSAPRSYYAGVDAEGGSGLVVLEDLGAVGARFVNAGEALTVDQVAQGLRRQAGWHAATWGSTPADLPGVRVGSMTRRAAKLFYGERYWTEHFARGDAPRYPAGLDDPALLYRAFQELWRADDAAVHCLQHGDAHVGNTYLRADGTLGFIDWQTYCLGPWAYDVAYFISGALTVADRRAYETDLLQVYLDHLELAGGPRIGIDTAWPAYVAHLVHGLIWTMTPPVMQPIERTQAMSERHVAAVIDHDAIFGRNERGVPSAR